MGGSLIEELLDVMQAYYLLDKQQPYQYRNIVVLLHQNKLLNQQCMDHNITILVWLLFIQQIICLHNIKQLLYQTSTHNQETTGRQLIKMPITQEPPMISQLIAFTMLQDTAVSHHPNKLLNQLFMDLNIMTLVWLQFTQQII
jgi:hypothetical protein